MTEIFEELGSKLGWSKELVDACLAVAVRVGEPPVSTSCVEQDQIAWLSANSIQSVSGYNFSVCEKTSPTNPALRK
jgi:hypothetical protein